MKKIEFLHLSDPHLLKSYTKSSLYNTIMQTGSDPTQNFIQALEYLNKTYTALDFILITGDLVAKATEENYAYFKNIVEKYISVPILYTLGNHDNASIFRKVFYNENSEKPFYYTQTINGFRIIVLDTCNPGMQTGKINTEQFNWLRKLLKIHSPNGSILAMHHGLGYGSYNALPGQEQELIDCIKHSDIKAVFTGHIHQNLSYFVEGIPFYTADSITIGYNDIDKKNVLQVKVTDRQGYSYCICRPTDLLIQNHTIREGAIHYNTFELPK